MEETHRGCLIASYALAIPRSNRWRCKVVIEWDEKSTRRCKAFDGPPDGFESADKAVAWGIAFGKEWIDGGGWFLIYPDGRFKI